MDEMTSNKPYLFRAFYEWIADNGLTPLMMVAADYPGVVVPREHVKEGRIVLNVAARAVTAFHSDNDVVAFNARFSGVARDIHVPMEAIEAIYARENGQGMFFEVDVPDELELVDTNADGASESSAAETDTGSPDDDKPKGRKSHLKVIK